MGPLLFLLWCSAVLRRCRTYNSRNSRFGGINSRLGRCKFPVGATTGIGPQGVDLPCRFRGQTALPTGKSKKFPVQRETSGISLGEPAGRKRGDVDRWGAAGDEIGNDPAG